MKNGYIIGLNRYDPALTKDISEIKSCVEQWMMFEIPIIYNFNKEPADWNSRADPRNGKIAVMVMKWKRQDIYLCQ